MFVRRTFVVRLVERRVEAPTTSEFRVDWLTKMKRSESKTTDDVNQRKMSKNATPTTSMSLDATSKGSRPRSKVHQALAIAASINNEEMMKGGNVTSSKSSQNKNRGNGSRSSVSKADSQGANSQVASEGGDYEGSKADSKNSSAALKKMEMDEMRKMVADLDRFDANDENDNLEDSF